MFIVLDLFKDTFSTVKVIYNVGRDNLSNEL